MKQLPSTKKEFLFGLKTYRMLLLAIGVIALGFVLMSGGGSDDPNVFNPAIFNFQRIRLRQPSFLLALDWPCIPFYLMETKNE